MKFGGKGDARGVYARFKHSLRPERTQSSASGDEEVAAVADSFINEDELKNFQPKGRAGIEVLGTTEDGAVDLNFEWDESEVDDAKQKAAEEKPRRRRRRLPSAELVFDGEPPRGGSTVAPALVRAGGRRATPEGDLKHGDIVTPSLRPTIPKLAIVMLVCGTRGDVQPFIALGLKLREYGHRVRLATHKDYRAFVTGYDLEFFPLGGDPKVLSDFIVKHRGVFTIDTKDAFENIRQVEDVVMSCWDACVEPDVEGDGRPFTAQAIIANPPAYGHVHCAEKLKIPLHMFFTMPWTSTRNFPHPLARIGNVRDTRPSSIAIRNYLSYIIVNEYVYTGLGPLINRFRKEKLHLQPLRMGNGGASLLASHNVPFAYCWSPSLVSKPSDWDDHIDVTGYFFLNEGVRSKYEPHKELADFLAAGPAPVYIGFGSLMVDDHKKVTEKILEAVKQTGQRLLLSKGWAGLGEGFDLPDSVLLLDDVPHDWLLPKCSAVVHHGGAGTTAAGLLSACPTTVIPFFGDQTFWGSAVYRRGVGPRPIPIDSLTTKKLIAALEFMQRPEVKVEALKVAELIKAEDGVTDGLAAFHNQLPIDKLLAGKPIEWELAKPSIAGFFSELGGGISDLFLDPVKGAQKEGVKGMFKGIGKGLESVVTRPLKGFGLAGYSVMETIHVDNLRGHADDESAHKTKPAASTSGSDHSKSDGRQSAGSGLSQAGHNGAAQLGGSQPKQVSYKRTFSFRMVPEEGEDDESVHSAATDQHVEARK